MTLGPANIERLVAYSPGKPVEEVERELGIKNAVKLASNENPRGPSRLALEAIALHSTRASRYPDAATWRLREALAAHHGVSMDEIVIGNGSNELIDLICRTYASPSDHAEIGIPSFVCYSLGLTTANVPFDAVPLRDHLYWDLTALAATVTDKTKVVFLANPNNPTGTYVGRDALARTLRDLPERIIVVIDEAYVDFVDADDYVSALELRDQRERLIVLRTFSKAYGLAALRVGYAIGLPKVVGYLNRTRPPFNVNTLGQEAACAALRDPGHVRESVEMNRVERARVSAALAQMGLFVAPSQANFVFVDFRRDNRGVYERMLRMGVIIRPMPTPVDTWLRITIGLPDQNDRLLKAVAELLAQ